MRTLSKPRSEDPYDAFANCDTALEQSSLRPNFDEIGNDAKLREELMRLEMYVLAHELCFALNQTVGWTRCPPASWLWSPSSSILFGL